MTGLYKVFVGARKSITWSREVLATLESLFHELLYSDRQTGQGKPTVRSPLFPNLLLLTAFVVGLVSPFLIWKGVLPGAVRWIADAAILMMIVLVIFRMLSLNHIPVAFWVIVFFSIIGVVVSLSMGQSLDVTVWGWWLMFQYPFVSLFAYLQPRWPAAFSKKFVTAIIFIAGLEVVVQLGQFVMGEVPGDNLAGTFGKNGTGRLVLVLSIVLAYALGEWLHNRKWLPVAAALGIGLASSVLGEMKLFYLVIVLMGGLAFGIYLLWGKQRWKMVPLLFLLVGALVVFIPIYDAIVPTAGELPLEAYFSNPALVRKYLTMIKQSATGGTNYYDIGRNFAIEYGWEKITEKTINLPFGYGLGARAESVSLGMTGRALAEKDLGFSSGTSALVIIQETGLVGLIGLLIFIAVTVSKLFMQIRQQPDSDLNPLRYGLLIFTLLWPLWLWYNAAWTLRTVMLLYWGILGYVFGENRRRSLIAAPPAVSQSEELTALNPRPMTGEIL